VHIKRDHHQGWNVQIAARKGHSVDKALSCSKQVITGFQWFSNCGAQTGLLQRKTEGHTDSGIVTNIGRNVGAGNSPKFLHTLHILEMGEGGAGKLHWYLLNI